MPGLGSNHSDLFGSADIPHPGTPHTCEGLLRWNQCHASVVAPTVYPRTPYVTRPLSVSELLLAMDVPGTHVKAASNDAAYKWSHELKLPFKVRTEVIDWVRWVVGTCRTKRQLPAPTLPAPKRARPASDPGTMALLTTPAGTEQHDPPWVDPQGAQKAAKQDDAEAPVHLWNEHVRQGSHTILDDQELDLIRACLLKYWKHLVARRFHPVCHQWCLEVQASGHRVNLDWIRKDAMAGTSAGEATWWDWPHGSAPFFWNWPLEYQGLIHDG
jgi:hypothetical protein